MNSRLQLGRVAGGGDSVGSETRAGATSRVLREIVDVVRKAVSRVTTNFGGSTLCTTSALARIRQYGENLESIQYCIVPYR